MRIAVVVSMEAGVEKAYAINSVNMAQGFVKLGHEVILITFANRDGKRHIDDLIAQYDVRVPLRWIQVPRIFRNEFISPDMPFAMMALFQLFRFRPDFVFVRSYIAPILSARFGFPTVAETHAHTDNDTEPFLKMIEATHQLSRFKKLITISDVLGEHYQSLGVPAEKMLVLPTGVDIDRFKPPDVLAESPYLSDKPNVAYIGHLYDYKGIPTILGSAEQCPQVNFHLIGGLPKDIDRVEQTVNDIQLENVFLHGFKPQIDIPPYLHHADILLLPPSMNHASAQWTSPVKLGEYLASGTPVIATRIPALEVWLSDDVVTFIEPDSASAMADAIQWILSNADIVKAKAERGKVLAQTFSYQQRAQMILDACGF